MSSSANVNATPPSAQIRAGQPKGLYLLFFTELWERFGFYTIQTIIILYMTKGLLMSDERANLLYAAYSALIYLTPMVGGYLADRYLGFQRAIQIGGVLFIIGYSTAAFHSEFMFFLGLSILICANGFFKPNVSSIVGDLYEERDPRRDGGFTIFYMGINLGALVPPLIAGTLVVKYGWHAGFILAACGMLLGQIIFVSFKKRLGHAGLKPKRSTDQLGKPFYILLSLGVLAVIGLCQVAFHYPALTATLIESAGVIVVLVVLGFMFKEPIPQRKRMFAALVLIIISIAFWAIYNQTFTSLMLFADRNMGGHFLGLPIDAEATQFFNPFFIVALSPLLSRLWIRLDPFSLNPSIQAKFSLGVLFMSSGLLLLAFGTKFFNVAGITSPNWLCASYFLQTIGELLLSPIGLAMITVLCPKNLTGMMMGVWFFSMAIAFALSGSLANIAAIPPDASVVASSAMYTHAFLIYGLIALSAAIISFSCVPFLTRMIDDKAYQAKA